MWFDGISLKRPDVMVSQSTLCYTIRTQIDDKDEVTAIKA